MEKHSYEDLRPDIKFDLVAKTIEVTRRMHMNWLYRVQKDQWDEPGYMQYACPMLALTPERYKLVNGWNFADEASKKNMMNAGWKVEFGTVTERWLNVHMLGDLATPGLKFEYQIDGGDWKKFKYAGLVNEPIPFNQGDKRVDVRGGFVKTSSAYAVNELSAEPIRMPIMEYGRTIEIENILMTAEPAQIDDLILQVEDMQR